MEEKLGQSQECVRELEERYADPTQLPEVKGFGSCKGSGRKAFFAPKRKCKRTTLTSIFLPVRSMEDVIAELSRASSSQASAVESNESDEEA